jgi:hypothetical protein
MDQVEREAREWGAHVKQRGWRVGLVVARNVEPGTGHGNNRKPKEITVSASKVSATQWAEWSGQSHPTVLRHLKAWELAAAEGFVPLAKTLKPGDEPDLAWDTLPPWERFYKEAAPPKPKATAPKAAPAPEPPPAQVAPPPPVAKPAPAPAPVIPTVPPTPPEATPASAPPAVTSFQRTMAWADAVIERAKVVEKLEAEKLAELKAIEIENAQSNHAIKRGLAPDVTMRYKLAEGRRKNEEALNQGREFIDAMDDEARGFVRDEANKGIDVLIAVLALLAGGDSVDWDAAAKQLKGF